jgi:peptide/nickel transport system permease protein
MGSYLIRRLSLMVLTLFGISVLIFVLLRVVPGNIADILFDAAGMVSAAGSTSSKRARSRQADRRPIRQLDRRSRPR